MGLLRPCFARTQTWLQAGKYLNALVSDLTSRNGWSVDVEQRGDSDEVGYLGMEAEIFDSLPDRDAASEAEGHGTPVRRPAANAVLTTAADTWQRAWTPRAARKAFGPLR
jgi:hypothetical protein